jgi:hypothetical protein
MSVFTTFLANIALCLLLINKANAECANACNGHGKCTAYDMCICNRNWQANDCSERVCQFGLAHVDTAKVINYNIYCIVFLSFIYLIYNFNYYNIYYDHYYYHI